MKATPCGMLLVRSLMLLFILGAIAAPADEPGVRASLQSPNQRKPAPEFVLNDSSGKEMSVRDYRGKVLLLDFWATWCHGCKQEIPWFAEFQRKYAAKGLDVAGISLDQEGWTVVREFISSAKVPYRIVLGDDTVAKNYGIENLPDTFLIDHDGKIAAAYMGLVNKNDVEANIQKLLSRPGGKAPPK
jgi:peroxiredoxin